MIVEFKDFGKIPRLSRECVISEKIDGTNAQVFVRPYDGDGDPLYDCIVRDLLVRAGSRNRWIRPWDDNFGFAAWVWDHADELVTLGPGRHYGEWWGFAIQRGYAVPDKRFSLFNSGRWASSNACVLEGQERAPDCCHVVPVLYRGPFSTLAVDNALERLRVHGSCAAPGFMDPEGVIVYHEAGGHAYKKTCRHDEEPKSAHVKRERAPRPPKNPNGRRVAQVAIDFPDRRRAA